MLRTVLTALFSAILLGCGRLEPVEYAPNTATATEGREDTAMPKDEATARYARMAEEAVPEVLKGDRLWAVLNRSESDLREMPEWGPLQELVDAAGVEVLVPPLIEGLKNPDGRMSAACALGRIGPRARCAAPPLLDLYGEVSGDERQSVVIALGKIGADSNEVLSTLTHALRGDESKYVRSSSAYSLGIIGVSSEDILAALLDGMEDRYEWVRYECAAALGRLGRSSHDVIAALATALDDDNADVAVTAVWALGQLGSPALPTLRKAAKSPKRHVRWKAEEVIED